jgi:hypothetical protein
MAIKESEPRSFMPTASPTLFGMTGPDVTKAPEPRSDTAHA